MEVPLYLLSIVWAILTIILFYKIWNMTNDVKDIRNQLLKDKENNKQSKADENNSLNESNPTDGNTNTEPDILVPPFDKLKVGDYVIRKIDAKRMQIDTIKNTKFFCKGGAEGYKWYSQFELTVE